MSGTTNTTISQNDVVPRTRGMSAKDLMSVEDFELLMDRLNALSTTRPYSPKSRIAARLVLVDGLSEKAAGAQVNLSSQSVNQLMKRIRSRIGSVPAGWIHVKGVFPAEVAKQLEALAELLQQAYKSGTSLDETHYSIALPQD
ncbi:hypothetical protein [Serratia proteamaculans]|uniref:hypothetical protein n=1 Tax=Serratia proteamaculans TaxID=28151 RepID=UPI003D07C066